MSDEPDLTTLPGLIDHALVKHGVRYVTDLTKIAQRDGFEVVHTTLNQIRKGTYQHSPSRKTLEAIAYLAGVSYETARDAAGLASTGVSFASQLPSDVDRLTAKQRRILLAVIREMIDLQATLVECYQVARRDPAPDQAERGAVGASLEDLGFSESQDGEDRHSK